MIFCNRLREMRQEKGYTQRELAALLNLSNNMVCEYEKGRAEPTLETLKKLSEILECSADYLIGNSDYLGTVLSHADLTDKERQLLTAFTPLPAEYKEFVLDTTFRLKRWSEEDI
ncbi:MAG: helix-turn-helix transcriptional regulator [Clostridia bacterium]|nr:helix-turn-helix transcriptional regulator [Clostridia bacterium]